MSLAPQNGFRERKVYHNFVLILYTESQILYTIPSCAIGNSNLDRSTETVAFQVYEILKIDHEFRQFF